MLNPLESGLAEHGYELSRLCKSVIVSAQPVHASLQMGVVGVVGREGAQVLGASSLQSGTVGWQETQLSHASSQAGVVARKDDEAAQQQESLVVGFDPEM